MVKRTADSAKTKTGGRPGVDRQPTAVLCQTKRPELPKTKDGKMKNHRQLCAFCLKGFNGPDTADWLKVGFRPPIMGRFYGKQGPACKRCRTKALQLLAGGKRGRK